MGMNVVVGMNVVGSNVSVGVPVGVPVGTLLGDTDGSALGDGLGTSLGPALGGSDIVSSVGLPEFCGGSVGAGEVSSNGFLVGIDDGVSDGLNDN